MTQQSKKFILLQIILSALIVFSTSCTHIVNPDDLMKGKFAFSGNTRDIKVYFTKSKNPETVNFVSVGRKVSKEYSEIDSSLKELFLGPTKNEELKGIMTEIPVGTRLIKVEESEDEILLDVSGQYLIGGGAASMQLRYLQLYKTLNEIVPGKKIFLYVDGKMIKTIGGEGLEVTQPLTKINDYTKKPKDNDGLQP